MVLMAIDHASFLVARVHAYEGWAFPAGPVTITRWITHLCAPGFMMLLGAGMVWLGKARQKAGWSHAEIRKFFITRGLILLVIQHFVENPAWILGILTADPSTQVLPHTAHPGDECLTIAPEFLLRVTAGHPAEDSKLERFFPSNSLSKAHGHSR